MALAHGFFSPRNAPLRAFTSASRIARPVSSDDARPFRLFGDAALTQRLQRLVDGLRRGGERRVALQRDPHALAGEIVEVAIISSGAPPSTIGSRRRGRDRFQLAARS